MLHCNLVNTLWGQLLPTLLKLSSKALGDTEKAFGIVQIKKTPGIILRNWLDTSFAKKSCYLREAHITKQRSPETFKAKFNQSVARDIKLLMYRFRNEPFKV